MLLPQQTSARRPAQVGFTLLELLVALTLLSVGLLGIASTTLFTARMQSAGDARSLAAALAESRVEIVRATQCVVASGDSSIGTIAEHWGVVPIGGTTGELADTIGIPAATSGTRQLEVFRSAVPC
jgi:prepilin-type N-terminal cleavage/methylation domain-containing protein